MGSQKVIPSMSFHCLWASLFLRPCAEIMIMAAGVPGWRQICGKNKSLFRTTWYSICPNCLTKYGDLVSYMGVAHSVRCAQKDNFHGAHLAHSGPGKVIFLLCFLSLAHSMRGMEKLSFCYVHKNGYDCTPCIRLWAHHKTIRFLPRLFVCFRQAC